jgi:DNA repair exonuclease SbcCD ATPase subunit
MADVNGGALSFTSIMDNDQMNAAIEETLRRVQGFSDAVVGSGDTMDNTTQEIVESIQIQKRVIEELEKTVADLNERINSVEPGTAQDALIEQANAARVELDGEKQGMVALINELNNLQRANEGAASASEDIRNGLSQIGAACEMHENAIAALKKEYEQITQTMNGALKSGNDNEYRALRDRAQAIKGEIATRKSLLNELREQSNALEDEASRMEQARAAAENTAQAHVSLRQQIRALKEEMADAVANGIDEQSEAYKRMVNELGRLQDIQGDIQSQGSVLANDEATFAGILSGLNGVVGGFTAAQGAVALFAGENENLQKIMLKVQSLMSITMGLQQVAQTLNKDSAFSLITLNKAKEWWNNLLAVGRGEQIASTAATAADTTATIASTAATTANAAAEQASNTAKTASVGATTGAAAAQAVQTASATAGTVANIGLAGAFRMVGAAIKSIPVFGWILAGISALIALVSHFVSKANESKKATEEWYNAIAENAYKPIASIMELSDKWNALGNDLEAKKQFIENNKKAFEDLGVSVRDVVDAENVLVANKTAFINAQIEKAKATIYLQQAQEKVKELIKKEQEYNAMSDTKSMWVQTSTFGTGYWVETANNEKKKAKTALDGLRAEISKGFQNAANAERNGWNILKKAGIGATQTYTKGSLGAIEQAIQLKQEALKHLTNNDDYKKAMAEIEKLQKQADKITGKTTTSSGSGGGSSHHRSSGGGGTKKDAFLEKLAKYKSEYSRFLKWVNSNDPIIQQAAKKEFDGLLKQGATYIDYLKNQRDIILQVDVANRSKTQNKQLRQLNDAIAEETKKTVLEAFNNELSDSLSNAKTVIEMLNVIEAKRKQLANDGTELDNAEKEALDNAEKQAQEKAKQQTDALLTEYASFVEQKRRLEEQFNADMELLNRKRAKASTDAERAEIDQAIANRTKKYNTDTSKVGDYDAILNQYGGYEQKKERIAEQYAERRRIAELNGNKDLLEKLAKAEQDELSKLQSDLIKNSGDWQNLFGNLDELTTKTIKQLIAKIEGMKATIGVDLNPQDLKALTDQLNKARSEVEKRNPFTALGAAWKRLKEATKDGKGLGSDEAKKATKDVATAVSGSIDLINGTFNAVTNGLQKMGVSMDEETQAILGDIGGIMDGASQVAQGIATGNPLSVIQGSIGLLSSAFDLFNSRDRKAEKQIKKHQKAIKQLENAYKQLEWQIGKALGGEVYKNQQAAIRNMKEQQEHLKASWEAEESKKKTDHDRVNDFKEQYAELGRQIEDMIDEISNDLLQTTAKDFANDLGDALVEAFSKGEDAAKAMETTVNSVLKNLVVNQLKKKFLENQLQGALDKLEKDMGYWNGDDFVFDGLTQAEIDRFKSAVGAASSNFNQALKQYEEIFKDMGLDDTDESLTGAAKGISEESANILAGQMNAIRINQLDTNEVLRQSLQALNTIAINTAYNKYLSRIERIITIMESNQGGNALRSQGLS